MATRKQDVELLDDIIRRSVRGDVKHHEVSLALQALERLERGKYVSEQPAQPPTEKK